MTHRFRDKSLLPAWAAEAIEQEIIERPRLG